MTYQSEKNMQLIKQVYDDILKYFQSEYMARLEEIQEKKTDLFELVIRIEELEKTKELYTFKDDDRRNLFSPIAVELPEENKKGRMIHQQIMELNEKRFQLNTKISDLEAELLVYSEKVKELKKAQAAMEDIHKEAKDLDVMEETKEPQLEFVEKKKETSGPTPQLLYMMHQEYEKKKLLGALDEKVKQTMTSKRESLEIFTNELKKSDTAFAKTTSGFLDEHVKSEAAIEESLAKIIRSYHTTFDGKLPAWKVLESRIDLYKRAYPNLIIEGKVNTESAEIKVPPMITLFLVNSLNELFMNALAHSKANKILVKAIFTTDDVVIVMTDNGVGVDADIMSKTKWYTGLHKIKDTIDLLNGEFAISGSLKEGTEIKCKIPY